MINDILGGCIGIRFKDRGDNHILLQLMIEDNETWHETDFCISSYWLDELVRVCQRATTRLKNQAIKDPDVPNGYKFNLTPTPARKPVRGQRRRSHDK